MERLKDLHADYVSSEEYTRLGEMPEVTEAKRVVECCLTEKIGNREFLEIEDLIWELAFYGEIQGFVYGFRLAVNILKDCGIDVGGDIA